MQETLFQQTEIIDPGFNEFWDRYDKKVSKKDAKRAWSKLNKRQRLEILNDDIIERYKESTPDKQYRLHPATWLNGEHWDDEIISKTKSGISDEQFGRLAATTGI